MAVFISVAVARRMRVVCVFSAHSLELHCKHHTMVYLYTHRMYEDRTIVMAGCAPLLQMRKRIRHTYERVCVVLYARYYVHMHTRIYTNNPRIATTTSTLARLMLHLKSDQTSIHPTRARNNHHITSHPTNPHMAAVPECLPECLPFALVIALAYPSIYPSLSAIAPH